MCALFQDKYYEVCALLQDIKVREYRKQKQAEKRKRKHEETEGSLDIDPSMAAMMGFAGFATTGGKK